MQAAYHNTHRANPPNISNLSDEDRRELKERSGISLEVMAARGYYTARSPSELPDAFPRWQRRPGLVVPGHSPSGAAFHQYKPRKPIRRKSGDGPRYETPQGAGLFIDANPLMLEEVRHGAGELWVTEGCKKVDALASWGVPAVGLTGVYMAAVPGTKGNEPLACWRHVRLKGRTVIIAFDADARTNADVQEALRRLVAMLEALGAVVLVVYVPAVDNDTKAGVDDYKAAGLTLEGLRRRAQPFVALDVGRERIRRDGKLRRAVRQLWAEHDAMPQTKNPECTDRATMRDLIRAAARRGKVVKDGVRVMRSARDGALATQASLGGWKKSVDRLEAAGRIRRAQEPDRRKAQAASYVLLTPGGEGRTVREHKGRRGALEGKGTQEGVVREEERIPLRNRDDDRGVHAAHTLGELRWPKVILYWERRNGKRVVADSYYVARLGKRRREIIAYLLERDSSADIAELMELFASPRATRRHFRSRILAPLEADGIIAVAADAVALTEGWCDALEDARVRTDELEDAKRQAEKYARQRKSFRNRDKTPASEEPNLMGKERVKELVREREREGERADIEEQRRKVGTTAAVFVADELAGVSGVRWRELRDRWIHRGGKGEDLRRAVTSGPFRFGRESADGDNLYVYPANSPKQSHASEARDPAPVAPLRPERPVNRPPKKEAPKVGGVHVHGPECDCWLCEDSEAAPSYAGSAS